jgi:hypothetical protein
MWGSSKGENSRQKKEAYQIIIENIDLFQVCEACDAIIPVIYKICPICKNYRFNNNEHYVKKSLKNFINRDESGFIYTDFI